MPRSKKRRRRAQQSRWKQHALWIGASLVVLVAAVALRSLVGSDSASAKTPAAPKKAAAPSEENGVAQAEPQKLSIMAIVNGEEISRQDLANECLAHYGKETLEGLINRDLILEQCSKRKVVVNDKEIQEEIDKVARRMSLPKDQFLGMLEKERGIKAKQYGQDIIWPTLALRKLAADKLVVTQEELDQGYESQFGPAVKARLISITDPEKAKSIYKKVKADPKAFPKFAKQYSEDGNSAQAGGLVQPIRRYLGHPDVEKAAFALREGEISPIIKVGSLHVIIKCEEQLAAVEADRKAVDPMLRDAIRDRKLRATASELFRDLQDKAQIQNVYNDPEASRKHPGVAAIINDHQIMLRDLAEECIDRHGIEVLEGTIHRRLLEQALKKKKLTVEQADIDTEISRAAVALGQIDSKGNADVSGWLKRVTKEQGVTVDLYVHDAVWPTAALKKLVGSDIEVTKEEIERGYEANYGRRARCRAIVCNNQRKAQEAWDQARDKQTVENFAKLAEKYSVDASSASMGGQTPPIRRYSGQPMLEREAFKLQAGEISGIIQMGQNFVILFCEGYTVPEKIELAAVRQTIVDDLHEKKLRLEMAKEFEHLKESAAVDNLLAGKIQTPKNSRLANPKLMESKTKDTIATRGSAEIIDGALRPATAIKK